MYIYFKLYLHKIYTFDFCYFLQNDQNGEHIQLSHTYFFFVLPNTRYLLNQYRHPTNRRSFLCASFCLGAIHKVHALK